MSGRQVTCDTHGRRKWLGHLVCAVCGHLYTTHDPSLSTHAPKVCACGRRLVPGRDEIGRELEFSGRICCAECWSAKLAKEATS